MKRKLFLGYWWRCLPIVLVFVVAACGAMGAVGAHIKGSYYLNEKDYNAGVRAFEKELAQNPDDPLANYYMGRYLLALEKGREALPYLKRAAANKPDDAEIQFWLGVGYWSIKDFNNERACYMKAIQINRMHLPAHIYLGHNFLDRGETAKALAEYDTALQLDPYQPEAMYHRALALSKLNRKKDERKAWIEYLENYPDGALAREAASKLNALGDFSFRNHLIGPRKLTLDFIKFEPGTSKLSPESMPSLRVIGEVMTRSLNFTLEIKSYYKNNQQMAQARGLAVKQFILDKSRDVAPERLMVEAYGQPEHIRVDSKAYSLNASVSFWTRRN